MNTKTGSKHWKPLADPYERLDLNTTQVPGPDDPRHCPTAQYNLQYKQALAEMRVSRARNQLQRKMENWLQRMAIATRYAPWSVDAECAIEALMQQLQEQPAIVRWVWQAQWQNVQHRKPLSSINLALEVRLAECTEVTTDGLKTALTYLGVKQITVPLKQYSSAHQRTGTHDWLKKRGYAQQDNQLIDGTETEVWLPKDKDKDKGKA